MQSFKCFQNLVQSSKPLWAFYILAVLAGIILSGCGGINHSSRIQQPIGQELYAGKGDVVIRVNQEQSLPNAFGQADVFGRKTTTGATIVQYLGIEGSKALFLKSGTSIDSGETTMSRTGLLVPTSDTAYASGMVGNTPVSATATKNSHVYIPPTPASSYSNSLAPVTIRIDMKKDRKFSVGGHIIEVLEASENTIRYVIKG